MRAQKRVIVIGATLLAAVAGVGVLSGCGKSCKYEGRTYEDGDEWACSDGCNTCICADGELGATRLACNVGDAGL
jgi:hypothetical protein